MRILNFVAFIAILGLAACDAPSGISSSPNAGPAAALASPSEAGQIFGSVCVATAPSFNAARQALGQFPFVQNSQTGTYYHRQFNLSVRIDGTRCSLVFGTNVADDAVIEGIAIGTVEGSPTIPDAVINAIDVGATAEQAGLSYYRLLLDSTMING